MITLRVLKALMFLVYNITTGVETKEEALAFVRQLDDLSDNERLYMDAALRNSDHTAATGKTTD